MPPNRCTGRLPFHSLHRLPFLSTLKAERGSTSRKQQLLPVILRHRRCTPPLTSSHESAAAAPAPGPAHVLRESRYKDPARSRNCTSNTVTHCIYCRKLVTGQLPHGRIANFTVVARIAMPMAAGSFAVACELMAEARHAAVRLLGLLQDTGADPVKQELVEQIVGCIDRARAAVHATGTGTGDESKVMLPEQGLIGRPPAGSKRRTRGCGEEARARIVSTVMDDGYAWRKYGEKSIHHHKNPRFYFRCAYKDELGCGARKQVERMEDDPSLFRSTYFGEHTPACPRNAAAAAEVDRDSRFVVQSTHGSFLRAEGEDQMPANMVEFMAEYWPMKDQLVNLVSSDVSFASTGELESLEGTRLEELMDLLWS